MAGGFNPLAKMFAGCPDNAFQKVPPGYAPFTFGQRVGAVVRNGEPPGQVLSVCVVDQHGFSLTDKRSCFSFNKLSGLFV